MKIAVLICSLAFDSQKALMKGIERKIRGWEDICSVFCCHVNISGNDNYSRGEYSVFDLPNFKDYDGIIFVRNTFQNMEAGKSIIQRIIASGVPCVSVDGYIPEFVNIVSDERANMSEITRHLIEVHECKRIYFLGGQSTSNDTQQRLLGYKDALALHGIDYEENRIYYGNFQYSSGVEAVDYFLNLEASYPDAIVCCNDEMAIGLITEFKRRGIKVPKDIKIAGIDFDSVSRIYTPRLTTAKRQQFQKGSTAVDVLHEYCEHHAGETISLPTSLYMGYSCGCTPIDDQKNDATNTNALAVDRYAQAELTQSVKKMTADLMGRHDYYELLDELDNCARQLKPQELYLCLNVRADIMLDYSDYSKALYLIEHEANEAFTEELICAVAINPYSSQETSEREYFERSQSLFPPISKGGQAGGTYYFFPIHYMNRNFGYAILGTSGELVRNDYFTNWCIIASNAFENARKQHILEQMISALDRMWIYDTLTGIYNRAGFFKLSENIVKEAISNKQPLCVVFIDADGLKTVNDKYGHDEGDNFIKGISDALKDIKRHGEIIMRYGGDEFVLLAAGYSKEDAELCVTTLENALRRKSESSGKPYNFEASIGYCITTLSHADELNALIESADKEMYIKKKIKKESR